MGERLIGPKTVLEDLYFKDHCFGALGSFFQILYLVEAESYGMILCNIS